MSSPLFEHVGIRPPEPARAIAPRGDHCWRAINQYNFECSVCGIVGYRVDPGKVGAAYGCSEYLIMAVMKT